MKKIFLFCTALAASSFLWGRGFKVNELYYYPLDSKSVEVTYMGNDAYTENTFSGDITIPATVTYAGTTFRVKRIGDNAFYQSKNLRSVEIADGIEYIGYSAFNGCENLENISIPSSVTEVSYYAFEGCSKLPIEDGIRYADKYMIEVVDQTRSNYTIREGTIGIPRYAFSFGEGVMITNLYIPSSVTNISMGSGGSFYNVLNVIYHGESQAAPWGARCLNGYIDGYLVYRDSTKTTIIGCDQNAKGEITISSTVDSILYDAFSYIDGITTINVPNSVKYIEGWAFGNIMNITYNGTLDGAPWGANNQNKYIEGYLVYSDASKTTLIGCSNDAKGEIVVPNTVTTINYNIFNYNTNITSVILPDNVNVIEGYLGNVLNVEYHGSDERAPFGAQHLNGYWEGDLLYSDATKTVLWACNRNATGDISIPSSVKEIVQNAFSSCYHISTLFVPSSVDSISQYAFYGYSCKHLIWNVKNCKNNNTCGSAEQITFGNDVESIPAWFCQNNHNITSVTLPNGLKSIGNHAFDNCSNLQSINIPASVTEIGEDAFYNCNSLPVKDGFRYAGTYLVEVMDKNLFTYTIPNGTQWINKKAFQKCYKIAYVTMLDGQPAKIVECATDTAKNYPIAVVDTAAYRAAWPLYKDRIVLLNDAKRTIQTTASNSYSALTTALGLSTLRSVMDLTVSGTINSWDILYLRNQATNLRILDLTDARIVACPSKEYTDGYSTADNALTPQCFTGINTQIKVLRLPSTLEAIYSNAINGDVQSLELHTCSIANSFSYASGLQNVKIHKGTYTAIPSELFYYCSNLQSVEIDEGITEIGSSAFYSSGLKTITLPTTLRTINSNAFQYCKSLSSIQIPEGVSCIPSYAFSGCSSLSTIQLPDGIREIGENAFYQCTSLYSINLPDSLQTIGSSAFRESRINFLFMPQNVERIGSYAFAGTNQKLVYINYNYSRYENYYNQYYPYASSTSTSQILGYIGGYLQFLFIPAHSRLKQIESYAFAGNTSLYDVTISGDSILTIGEGAFSNCQMDTLILPPHLTSLSPLSFGYCSNLRYVAMPNTMTEVAHNAFVGCSYLDDVQFSANIRNIGHHAFANCSNLRNINIPSMVTNIEDYAFMNCYNVQSIYSYLMDPFHIGQNTFAANAYSNATLYIPNYDATEMKYLDDTQWNQFLNMRRIDSTYHYTDFYIIHDYILEDGDNNIDGKPDAEFNPGSAFIGNLSDTIRLGVVILHGDNNSTASILGNGKLSIDTLKVSIDVTGYHWYFFCFPFDIPLDMISCTSRYVFRSYNGQLRANNEVAWQNLPEGTTTLQKGRGYIFCSESTGQLNITIPNPSISNEDINTVLQAYSAGSISDASWNFIGNPYTSYYDLDSLYESGYTMPIICWNGYAYTSYRPGDDDYHLAPFEGFFVQKPADQDNVNFPSSGRESKNQADSKSVNYAPRRQQQASANRYLVDIVLLDSAQHSNRARVVLNSAASTSYELGVDAPYFGTTSETPLMLYSIAGDTRYSINETPTIGAQLQLGYYAQQSGYYTLHASRMDTTICIYDNEMRQVVDLSQGDYTFYTEAGTNETRFAMRHISTVVTTIDEANMPNGLSIHGRCVTISGHRNAAIAIYSNDGRLVYEHVGNGSCHLTAGTYILSMDNQSYKFIIL